MPLLLQPLFQENHHEHGSHDKIQPFCAEGNQRSENSSQSSPENPVKVIQQRHKKHEPSPVHILRNLCRIVDGKSLITHAENQINLFQSRPPEPVQHGDAVKQVPGVDHQRHGQRLQRIERPQKQIHRHKFHRPRKDRQTHDHGVPETESGHIHINPIGHSQKPEPGKNRDGEGKRCHKSLF